MVRSHDESTDSGHGELIRQGLRYAVSGAIVLGVKIAMATGLGYWLTPVIAYLFVHAIIFVVSYVIHSKFTFGSPLSKSGMGKYFKAVALIKAVDFLVFACLSTSLGIATPVGIVIASVLAIVIRFVLIRNALFVSSDEQKATKEGKSRHGDWAFSEWKWDWR